MPKIVWDMDPGIDDALALILALCSPEIQILGITTVAGNAPVEMTSANACRILEYLGTTNIPVVMGAAKPLIRSLEDALDHHGADGLGNCGLPPPLTAPYPAEAHDFLAQLLLDNVANEAILIATGPLTNVARAFESYPRLPQSLTKLIIMGGAYGLTAYGKGNRTPFAEFNIWQDPEAAQVVFWSGANIFVVGLDVTMDPGACLDNHHLEQLRAGKTPSAHLASRLVEYEVTWHGCCRMHDPIALAILLDASLIDFVSARVEVLTGNDWKRGITQILSFDSSSKTHVACSINGSSFVELFLSRLLPGQG